MKTVILSEATKLLSAADWIASLSMTAPFLG
jgi:hypothetical protein